jgi:hypothetical protein
MGPVLLFLLHACLVVHAYDHTVSPHGNVHVVNADDDEFGYRGINLANFDAAVQWVEQAPDYSVLSPPESPMEHSVAIEWYQRKTRTDLEKFIPPLNALVRAKLWMHNQGALPFSLPEHDSHWLVLQVCECAILSPYFPLSVCMLMNSLVCTLILPGGY